MRYRAKDALPLTENAMNWWKSQKNELPVLSILAKRYLCIPGTSVPAERVFSTAGDIVKAQRSVLRPDHVVQLIFLKKKSVGSLKSSWLHLTYCYILVHCCLFIKMRVVASSATAHSTLINVGCTLLLILIPYFYYFLC